MAAWGKSAVSDKSRENSGGPDDYDYEPEDDLGVEKAQVKLVQLDGLVVLKMIKHCTENVPEVVTGLLLGLDVGEKLEVTNCFPALNDEKDEDGDEHQLEMMKNFRAVNVDNNTVGWYQSALLGSWINASIIENQYSYQMEIPNSVVVVYDPFRTTRGKLALKAYRLTDEFMDLKTEGEFSHVGFAKHGVDSSNIFEEIPIKVHNSHLVHGFLYELREKKSMSCEFDRLNLSTGPFMTKTLGILSGCVDEYSSEQSKFQYIQRQIARQKAAAAAKSSRGDDGEDDASKVKIMAQPSRLDTFLLANQMSSYCSQIQSSAALSFNRLYVAEGLAKDEPSYD